MFFCRQGRYEKDKEEGLPAGRGWKRWQRAEVEEAIPMALSLISCRDRKKRGGMINGRKNEEGL